MRKTKKATVKESPSMTNAARTIMIDSVWTYIQIATEMIEKMIQVMSLRGTLRIERGNVHSLREPIVQIQNPWRKLSSCSCRVRYASHLPISFWLKAVLVHVMMTSPTWWLPM